MHRRPAPSWSLPRCGCSTLRMAQRRSQQTELAGCSAGRGMAGLGCSVFQPICGTERPGAAVNLETRPGTMPRPSRPPFSSLPSKSSCSPRQMPRYGFPASRYSLSGSRKPCPAAGPQPHSQPPHHRLHLPRRQSRTSTVVRGFLDFSPARLRLRWSHAHIGPLRVDPIAVLEGAVVHSFKRHASIYACRCTLANAIVKS